MPRLSPPATNSTTAWEVRKAAPWPAHAGEGRGASATLHTLYAQWTLWRALPGCGQGPPAAASAGRQSSPGAGAGLGTAPSVCATPPAWIPADPAPDRPGPKSKRMAEHSQEAVPSNPATPRQELSKPAGSNRG